MEKLLNILSKIKPNIDFSKETHLIENGILTSFDIIRLVVELNNEFDVEITPLHTVPENFESAEAILKLIEMLQEEE